MPDETLLEESYSADKEYYCPPRSNPSSGLFSWQLSHNSDKLLVI